ncbi:TlpA disulfide reductase family protein [uncultured Paenibacillus sp.]|uniref:TlpA family protein disulfide reductase n=1 Tax=uncultured Paenibacillus sp. TaxID=227322 RepID=UPI0028D671D1|nr:TlpA disulfide reductase family protein [uncultured Paenibacillus sp.]
MGHLRKQLLLLIAVGVLVVAAILQPNSINKEKTARIGFQAPEFELKALDGGSYSLASLNGKPVLINFWASWCNPCRLEAPELVRLYAKYKGQIEVYAVNLTSDDTVKGAAAFAEEFGFTFPVLLDEKGTASKSYKIKSIPTTYFVDGNGQILDVVTGLASPDTLEKLIIRAIEASREAV